MALGKKLLQMKVLRSSLLLSKGLGWIDIFSWGLGAGVVGVEGGSERETCWETFRVQTCSPLFWPFLSWLCRRKARLTQLIFLLLADQVEDRSLLEDLIEDLERQNQYPDYQYRWTPLCFGQRRETRSPSILWQQLLALAVTKIQKKHRYCKQI